PRGAAHAVALSVQAHRFLKVGRALGRRRTSQFLWGILLTLGRFQALSPISESEATWGTPRRGILKGRFSRSQLLFFFRELPGLKMDLRRTRCGSGRFRIGQRKQITRIHLLSETGSD